MKCTIAGHRGSSVGGGGRWRRQQLNPYSWRGRREQGSGFPLGRGGARWAARGVSSPGAPARPAGRRVSGVGRRCLHLQGPFSRQPPSQAVLRVAACVSCPAAGLEPAERWRLTSRSSLGGGVPPGWEAQKPLGSYPGPHRHAVKVFHHPFLPLPPREMAFVPSDTLSQPVGGGREEGAAWEAE